MQTRFLCTPFIKSFEKILPFQLKRILVQALLMPHFDYCNILLTNLTTDLSQRLQRVHNACVRFICNTHKYDQVFVHFNNRSWLRLNKRRQLHCLTLLLKIPHSSIPNYLASRLELLSSHHNFGTSSQYDNLLTIPHHKTSQYSTSFTIFTIRTWNTLPQYIRSCCRLETFKLFVLNYLSENNES